MDQVTCVDKLKILADTTRLGVLQKLQFGPQSVGALMTALDVEQTLLSHHLRVLRQAKFVIAERNGKQVLYRLSPDVLIERNSLNLDCCVLSFR
ncbi:ArsR family transcriptional regulator [Leptolyngbyaceae cyanobacterium CCMR0082]|uniref:ArsR family transcriptional regulator n=2 Tax=Adonisia turfae TaxID=2950184 RepID=A0A6M0RZL2_9CYAN|nr:metalloregulator ArsR/SmtB family transcription factor [Adonisia turfae]MDV3352222.1 metalloregulator ArsR/SmtB family transcription factor [Leptothoe sp. LEGE 181152]NEZ57106.1 ArsR family transcriptional regulator [Adonisia turfae CCMR0081]NEZ61644.1 ArsR family transcriptional regulator [Adonisia turfae CCMR0082]